MPRPMMFFVPAILLMPLGTVLVSAQTSLAEPAAEECKTKPGSSAPPGSHWYYRRCWFLGPEGAKVRSQARETASNVSSPTRTLPRENGVETARAITCVHGTRTKDTPRSRIYRITQSSGGRFR